LAFLFAQCLGLSYLQPKSILFKIFEGIQMKRFIALAITLVSLNAAADGEPWKASVHVTTNVQCSMDGKKLAPIFINQAMTVGMTNNIGITWVKHEGVYPVTTLVTIWYQGANGFAAEVETIVGEGDQATVALKGTLSRMHSLKDFSPLVMSNNIGIKNEASCLVESTVGPSVVNY
jgi:hypothetical protein